MELEAASADLVLLLLFDPFLVGVEGFPSKSELTGPVGLSMSHQLVFCFDNAGFGGAGVTSSSSLLSCWGRRLDAFFPLMTLWMSTRGVNGKLLRRISG